MSTENKVRFCDCIGGLLSDPSVQSMGAIHHHFGGVSCLNHCLFVAYLSFIICDKLGLDSTAAARAGLLHDLYLDGANDVGRLYRLSVHPKVALENAERFGLSAVERDIIVKHMWPINPTKLPRYRESVIVNLADKICAIAETSGIYYAIRMGERLRFV